MKVNKQNKWTSNLFIIACCTLLAVACSNVQNQEETHVNMNPKITPLDKATKEALQTIVNSRVLFAHHSLGDNILEGLEEIISESGLSPEKLIQPYEGALAKDSILVHAKPGENKFPNSKVDGFAEIIRGLDSFAPQVASMKFCFVDFDPYTDVDEVFNYYKDSIDTLKKERPDIKFAHVTAPLRERRTGIKQRLNRLLGRMVWGDESNLKRAEFNKRLYETFKGDPIFDLARVESTQDDGSREQHTYKNQHFYSLVPEYTYDGAHLNATGKRIVAIEMARFLGETLKTGNSSQ